MLGMKRECETWQLLSDVTSLAAAAMAVFSDMETFLEDFPEFEGGIFVSSKGKRIPRTQCLTL